MKPEDVPRGPLLVDTDVFSFVLTQRGRFADFEPFLEHRVLALSFVTVGELWFGAINAGWGATRRKELELRIATHLVLYPDIRAARQWAELYRDFRSKLSGNKGAHDLWIAACALVFGLPLVTNNLSDFRPIAARYPLVLVHPDL